MKPSARWIPRAFSPGCRRYQHSYRKRSARLRNWRTGAQAWSLRDFWRNSRHPLSRRSPRVRRSPFRRAWVMAMSLGRRTGRLRKRNSAAGLSRRQDRSQQFRGGALGSDSAQPLYVGVGANRARVSEALLVLFGVEDGRAAPRQRASDAVMEEVVQLRRLGFRFIALADDNFYPVTLTD